MAETTSSGVAGAPAFRAARKRARALAAGAQAYTESCNPKSMLQDEASKFIEITASKWAWIHFCDCPFLKHVKAVFRASLSIKRCNNRTHQLRLQFHQDLQPCGFRVQFPALIPIRLFQLSLDAQPRLIVLSLDRRHDAITKFFLLARCRRS